MKKETTFSILSLILIFFVIIFSLNNFNKENKNNNQLKNNQTTKKNINFKNSQSSKKIITFDEIKKHNQANDCWIIIENKVYDVTNYRNHPGGRTAIENYCGQDATNAFQTKGMKNQPHSQRAERLLENFYIGELDENK